MDLFRAVCELDMDEIAAKRPRRREHADPKATTWVRVKNRDCTQARNQWELFAKVGAVGRGS